MNENKSHYKSIIITQLQKELDKNKELILSLERTKDEFKKEDELIQIIGANLMETIKAQIADVRKKMDEIENQLIEEEQKYSNLNEQIIVIENPQVGLTESELIELQKLTEDYNAFNDYISKGVNERDNISKEACAWSACWTCSAACGGCTGCGQACTQVGNALAGNGK